MAQLLFRSCEASDGRRFALLTGQPEVEECFDNGYKVAYKDCDSRNNSELLGHWKSEFTVASREFNLLPESGEIPAEIAEGFKGMISNLIKGIDVFFCDYNLGVEGDLPMCDQIMDKYRSTDFTLFSQGYIIGNEPTNKPYIASYLTPRYQTGGNTSQQHRIYCKSIPFAISQAINAITEQRTKDNLTGGHIRSDIDVYINEPACDKQQAQIALNRFIDELQRLKSKTQSIVAAAD